jgi:hypothetical protein
MNPRGDMNAGQPINPSEVGESFVSRIRALIDTAALDCDCRERVNDALQRFVEMEQHRIDRRHLLSSRQHRAAIGALMSLLADLEEVGWQEADRSVFAELALLFEDIARHALAGAENLRSMGGGKAP